MNSQIETIRGRNRSSNIACERTTCSTFRCACVKADVDVLLAEIDRLANRIRRAES